MVYSSLMQKAPLIISMAMWAAAVFFVGRFNLRTFWLVRGIQGVAKREGTRWYFYRDFQRRSAFVWRPEDLLEPLDSEKMRAAKQRLLDHRKTLWRTILTSCAIMLVGFICAIAVPVESLFSR
jgi:hypothetical protein